MSNAVSGQGYGDKGISPPGMRPDYKTYRSPHAPQYKIGANFHGINRTKFTAFAFTMGTFGAVFGLLGLYFISDIPKVRQDIMTKIPLIGDHWKKEVPPEDNPF